LAELRSALDEYLVVYLPGQSLDRFQLDRLGRYFARRSCIPW